MDMVRTGCRDSGARDAPRLRKPRGSDRARSTCRGDDSSHTRLGSRAANVFAAGDTTGTKRVGRGICRRAFVARSRRGVMPKIARSMIVRDSAATLRACLESVRGVADEIVIADTGSTDDTLAIAREFGARTIEIPWENDFAGARNHA